MVSMPSIFNRWVQRNEDRYPQPVRLEDYRPTPYLIDTVDLDFGAARPGSDRAAGLGRQPQSRQLLEKDAALVLDGERITLRSVSIDGVPLGP